MVLANHLDIGVGVAMVAISAAEKNQSTDSKDEVSRTYVARIVNQDIVKVLHESIDLLGIAILIEPNMVEQNLPALKAMEKVRYWHHVTVVDAFLHDILHGSSPAVERIDGTVVSRTLGISGVLYPLLTARSITLVASQRYITLSIYGYLSVTRTVDGMDYS